MLHDPPVARPVAQPHTLTYDDLPPGSALRRQFGEDGSVAITAPAGEPSHAARRAALHVTGVVAALMSASLLVVLCLFVPVMSDGRPRIDPALRLLGIILFAVFCGGIFLLNWRTLFDKRMEWLSKARQQSTLLYASPARLLVETSGPEGDRSLDLPAEAIHSIRLGPTGLFPREFPCCLQITATDGSVHRLLTGHHRGELTWVVDTLRQTLGNRLGRTVQ